MDLQTQISNEEYRSKSRVSKVEHIDEDKDVYDFYVPGPHSYVVEGFMSHNSALAVNLMRNMSEAGYDVAMVPLEMKEDECTGRLMSNISGVPLKKFLLRKTTKNEKKVAKKAMKSYINNLKEKGSKYTIFKPGEDMTIDEVLLLLKPYDYDVVLIDYISLLKGADGDDQWKQLGAIARRAKIFADNNDCVVILLAQLDDEKHRIRYARSIAEHANNAWAWAYTEASNETGIVDIRQLKSRNQEAFPFQLAVEFDVMRFRDVESSDFDEVEETEDAQGNRKRLDEMEEEEEGGEDYLDDLTNGGSG